ncbi:LAME_0H11782g1_1 [Lachancea meyersii CBS 8951]|uniref:LAME_0H11782g1_1 n=1 Tax=Lachancea meyersii CBS 8951 TaxID=1266667 RepID=A0A1G4KGB0_9SACH|nr:LAME_0H11782g1_1 [Lachancea meyersii CBS 8951]
MVPRAPYHVKLTADHQRVFELLNSLCAVENYGQLLSYLEARLRSGLNETLVVPPADVLIVLMTLTVIPDSGTSDLVVKVDPFSVAKTSVSSRSLKILHQLVKALQKLELQHHYNIQLLRCQFFILLDHLNSVDPQPSPLARRRASDKRRKTNSRVVIEETPSLGAAGGIGSASNNSTRYRNPYTTYVSVLEHRCEVFKNVILTTTLGRQGEFWNSVTWALVSSISEDTHLFERSKQWTQLLSLIFDLFELQNDYYYKLNSNSGTSEFTKKSPLLRLFRSLDTYDIYTAFCDILLVGLEYSNAGSLNVHAVYAKELKTPSTYVSRTGASQPLKFIESMAFRHRLLRLFTALSRSLPEQSKDILSEAEFIKTLSRFLSRTENLTQLKQFFCVAELAPFLELMPHIAQATLNECLLDFESHKQLSLVDVLGGDDTMIKELIEVFGTEFPPLDEEYDGRRETFSMSIERCDICLLVILRYWEFVHKSSHLKTRQCLPELAQAIHVNDQKRLKFFKMMRWDDLAVPLLSSYLKHILG